MSCSYVGGLQLIQPSKSSQLINAMRTKSLCPLGAIAAAGQRYRDSSFIFVSQHQHVAACHFRSGFVQGRSDVADLIELFRTRNVLLHKILKPSRKLILALLTTGTALTTLGYYGP